MSDEQRTALLDIIGTGADAMPRGKQTTLGPSEAGHPCDRRLAYTMTDAPKVNVHQDPLKSVLGSAFHEWLAWAAKRTNERLGHTRYLTEQKLVIEPDLVPTGTCDLLDTDLMTVIDWKTTSVDVIKRIRSHGVSAEHHRQKHLQRQLYGYGWARLGVPVKSVGNCFIPRNGYINDIVVDIEPYDESVCLAEFERLRAIRDLTERLDLGNHPERYELVATEHEHCQFCPWWSPRPDGPYQCHGWSKEPTVTVLD